MFFRPGNNLQASGVIAKAAYQLGAFIARHADHGLVWAEVYSGGVWVDLAHLIAAGNHACLEPVEGWQYREACACANANFTACLPILSIM